MSLFSRVSWKDGMFLLPQHFQQADRALEADLRLKLDAVHPLGWGVLSLQLNEAAVAQGRLELTRCQAILPDGLVVDVPEADAAPAPRLFQLPTAGRNLEVFLTVPLQRPRAAAISAEPRADVRYVERVQEVPD